MTEVLAVDKGLRVLLQACTSERFTKGNHTAMVAIISPLPLLVKV